MTLKTKLLAPLLSIVIFSGKPLELIAFLKNAITLVAFRVFDNIKSPASPSLSTAQYRQCYLPFIFI